MSNDLTKVGAFWLRDSKSGAKFMSGKIEQALPEGTDLLVFKNGFKKEDRHPDYEIFIKQVEQPEAAEPSNTTMKGPSGTQTRKAMAAAPADDIPF